MSDLKFNARAFARLGQSGAIFGMAAVSMMDKYPIVCVSADMSTPAGLDRFKRSYPENFINVGIAEQNMLGIAAGLSSEGLKPICVSQAAFISMRSFEMVRQFMGYMKYPIIAVGLSSGYALSFLGNTHYSIEDLSVMRAIPGLWVFSPADAGSAVKIFEKALELGVPAYIRLTAGLNPPIIYKEDYDYNPLKIELLKKYGRDIAIFATGSMVYQSLEAAKVLAEEGINCSVYDVSCIKPIDEERIISAFDAKLIVTVEEHSIIGGLGSAVADILAKYNEHPCLLKIGIDDCFSEVGEYAYLLEKNGLTYSNIVSKIKELLKCRCLE